MSNYRPSRVKYLADINQSSLPESTDPDREIRYLDISGVGRGAVVAEPELMTFAAAPSRARRLVRDGDTIVSTVRTYLRAVLPIKNPDPALVVSTGFAVLTPTRAVDPSYFAWVVQSDRFVEEIVARSVGVSYPAINASEIGDIQIPVVGLSQQRAIADYLDTETARIDALITKKQRMIELLDERLQVQRRRAFGDQRGWRLKHLLRAPMAYGILVPQFVDPESGVRMLRITNLDSSGGVVLSEVVWVPRVLSQEYRRTLVASGDLVVSVVGSMGRSSVISNDVEGSNLNRALARVQLRSDLDPWVMWHWTQTTEFLDQARLATGGGTAQPTLNLGDLAEFTVGLPANAMEWPGISESLSHAFKAHQSLTSRLRSQIDLLRERRQALITAAVTGELEIPGVAA